MKKAWTVATGKIDMFNKRSRQAVKFIQKQEGLVGMHPSRYGCLWLFKTEADAIRAKNLMEAEGIHTGNNICEIGYD